MLRVFPSLFGFFFTILPKEMTLNLDAITGAIRQDSPVTSTTESSTAVKVILIDGQYDIYILSNRVPHII
jgi:hypothetical protein